MDRQQYLVQDWMSSDPLTVGPDTSAVEAYERMRQHNVHRLPVVAGGRLVGIVTRSDIEGTGSFQRTEQGWHEARFALAGTLVEEVMTRNPLSVTPSMPVREAVVLMLQNHVSGLPVVEDDRLVGIITETDVFRMVVDMLAE